MLTPIHVISNGDTKVFCRLNILENCELKNILDRHTSNNDRGLIAEHCRTEQLKHSFFGRTVVEWNHLNTATVPTETVESFKQALPPCY